MSEHKARYDEEWDDQEEPAFQPLRKQTGKAPTLKGDRRQQAKEWGRSMHKFHKQRPKTGKP